MLRVFRTTTIKSSFQDIRGRMNEREREIINQVISKYAFVDHQSSQNLSITTIKSQECGKRNHLEESHVDFWPSLDFLFVLFG